jgi:hypothetical protein
LPNRTFFGEQKVYPQTGLGGACEGQSGAAAIDRKGTDSTAEGWAACFAGYAAGAAKKSIPALCATSRK